MARVKSIEEQLYKILRKSEFGGHDIDEVLIIEANRLKELLDKHIRAYYASHKPTVYERRDGGNAMAKALRVETTPKNRSITIYFDENTVWGPSVVNERKWGYGFTPILIDTGWDNKNISLRRKENKPVRMFDYYEGYNFIQKAISEFERDNKYGLSVRVKINPGANSEFGKKFALSSKAKDIYDSMGN